MGRLHAPSSWLLGLAMLALIVLCVRMNGTFFHDDAFITLRYARHLREGLGPIWNRQGPRVEGFTSPLHMMLVSAVSATRIPMPMVARIVNVTSHLALLLFIFLHLKRRVGAAGAQLGVTLVAASWIFLVWDLGGLEAVLYAALVTMGVLIATDALRFDGPRRRQALILGSFILTIATLARPEGSLLLAGSMLLIVIAPRMPRSEKLKTLAWAVGLAALVLVPVEVFRVIYFHQIAPNTMYAKIGGISHRALFILGLRYLKHFALAPPYLVFLTLAAGIYSFGKKTLAFGDAMIWMFVGISALFIMVSGGDHMYAYRFCLPTYSLLAVLLVLHLAHNGLLNRPLSRSVVFAGVALVLLLQAFPPGLNPKNSDVTTSRGRAVGLYIQSHWRPGSVVALGTAGSTPFYADNMQYIDTLGLNDTEIAHRKNIPENGPWTHLVGHLKGDGASVLRRRPDYMILGPVDGTTPELQERVYFIGDYEIGTSPILKQEYQPCMVPLSDEKGPFMLTYFKHDLTHPCP